MLVRAVAHFACGKSPRASGGPGTLPSQPKSSFSRHFCPWTSNKSFLEALATPAGGPAAGGTVGTGGPTAGGTDGAGGPAAGGTVGADGPTDGGSVGAGVQLTGGGTRDTSAGGEPLRGNGKRPSKGGGGKLQGPK